MATLQIQAPVSWTTAKLVPEALKHSLHVVEDPTMIHLLGRAKFLELIVFGPVGWQKGVSFLHFNCFLRIYENLCCFLLPRSKSRELPSVKVYTLESANLFLLIVTDFFGLRAWVVLQFVFFHVSTILVALATICSFVYIFWKYSNSSMTTLKSKHIHLDSMFFKLI
jgi:hypothetical protein